MLPSILVLLSLPSFRVVPHIVSSYVDIFLALSTSTRLISFRAWIHQLRFYSSLARFSRAYTSHCLVLNSSSPRTKVRLVDTCIRVLLTPTYQTSTIKQGVKQPTSPTLLNAFASSKSRSGQKMHLHIYLWAHQPVERARVLAVSRNRTPWVTTISWT